MTVAFPPDALVARVDRSQVGSLGRVAGVDRVELGRVDPSSVAARGATAAAAVAAWNLRFETPTLAPKIATAQPSPFGGPDADLPPAVPKPPPRTAGALPQWATSSFMAGTIAYSVVFVQASGRPGTCSPADVPYNPGTWDVALRTRVLANIARGMEFWTNRTRRPSPLSFLLDDRGVVLTSCEPTTRPRADKNLWMPEALTALGRPTGTDGIQYYVNAQAYADERRRALGTDWDFLVFVVFGSGWPDAAAYAALGGPYVVQPADYVTDDWRTVAHETGHVFGAGDEYKESGCKPSDVKGYLLAANASCNNGGVTSDVSIMGEWAEQLNPNVDVSASARDAIGWRNPEPRPDGKPGSVVDVVRTSKVSLNAYTPNPTTNPYPTFFGRATNVGWTPSKDWPVTISRVVSVERTRDGSEWSAEGTVATDGLFDEETEDFATVGIGPLRPDWHTVSVRAVNQFGYRSPPATQTLMVLPAPPVVSVADAPTLWDGHAGMLLPATFAVTLSKSWSQPVRVAYRTVDESATAPGDYEPQNGTVVFDPGQTVKQITVSVRGDALREPLETFAVVLSDPEHAELGRARATGTIDDLTTVSISDARPVVEPDGSADALAEFTVTLSKPPQGWIYIEYETFDGGATAPSDYVAKRNKYIVFNPGETSKIVTVSVHPDSVPEAPESFGVRILPPRNVFVSRDVGYGTIVDKPTVSVAPVTKVEPGSGSGWMSFTATLNKPSVTRIELPFTTADGNAIAFRDYVPQTGSFVFLAGDTSSTISVAVLADHSHEYDEQFYLELLNSDAAVIPRNFTPGTIIDHPPADAASWVDRLETNWTVDRGGWLYSPQSGCSLQLQSSDGHLVLLSSKGHVLWKNNRLGGDFLVLQADGNLVAYTYKGQVIWASNTYGKGGTRLVLQGDCNLVLYTTSGVPVWDTKTYGQKDL